MKKFVITVITALALIFAYKYLYYNTTILDSILPEKEVSYNVRTNNKDIEIKIDDKFEPIEIRGVNLGSSYPGKWPTDYAIDKETYLKWFSEIKLMGANCIRVYTQHHSSFYDAFYEYNKDNPDPLYLIHGVWIDDYNQNSYMDAFNHKYINPVIDSSKKIVDIVHGNARASITKDGRKDKYDKDISKWVIGYIIGSEWRDSTVVYTDKMNKGMQPYNGKYIKGTEDISPFENMLAEVQNKMISYESKKYGEQRLISFSNWKSTDPFDYSKLETGKNTKVAKINCEHIKSTDSFKSGIFASYHLYVNYPDYYEFEKQDETYFYNKSDDNSYKKYLEKLNKHHSIPVIIAEYGVSTGRGITVKDSFSEKTQGHLNEQMQGEALVSCYEDIISSGCSGSLLFCWQDDWSKRTANTSYAINELKTPYWNDKQTDDQFFGILSFDPGSNRSVCYVDGQDDEWDLYNVVSGNKDLNLSMKYDEQNVYFRVYKKDFDEENDTIYIPIDLTPNSGSNYCENFDIKFDRQCDFLIVIDGKDNSKIYVQERYNSLNAMYSHEIYNKDAFTNPPHKNSPVFTEIRSLMKTRIDPLENVFGEQEYSKTFPSGLLEYGNANPTSENFNSLADFYFGNNIIEIKIPWGLLNFSNPSEMMIHDDYYKYYGVEELKIDSLYAGISDNKNYERINTNEFELKGWRKNVKFHERLKRSYYIIKEHWTM